MKTKQEVERNIDDDLEIMHKAIMAERDTKKSEGTKSPERRNSQYMMNKIRESP